MLMAASLVIPDNYRPSLRLKDVESAIKDVKDFFQAQLADALNLTRVTAPLFVRAGTGVNDDLNGLERPVSFRVRGDEDAEVEMVQSLAKWKRLALARYGFGPGEGLYTDMNAVRPDEVLDNLHSIYVDQWDWEKIITPEERSLELLKETVRSIYEVVCRTEFHIASCYQQIRPVLPKEIVFCTTEDLVERYPDLDPREREDRVCAEHRAVFLIGIGAELADGRPHDGRAPDYDDWTTPRPDGGRGLNGDILLWNPVLNQAFEISSMGIRVDAECLHRQLKIRGNQDRAELPFHQLLLEGKLPQTMGGGIGQSRLCMFFLRTAHIGEVAVGIWPEEMEQACARANIFLL
jgi:aspartate--ammonia ligase